MNGFMSRRSRRAAQPWIALVVAIVTLGRALIPVGFMPSTDAGFHLVLCSGQGLAMPGDATSSHDGQSAPRHDSSICPFAAASVVGTTAAFASAPVAVILPTFQAPRYSSDHLPEWAGPPRAQSPRAPPTFSS
jgi:hypothetical protein